jgi:ATP-dependent Clp protease ATP-binding subunit ClpC
MFEKYTEKARRVIFFARYEASQFGAQAIDAEHILLGLLREDKQLTQKFFHDPHSTVESIRKEIEGRTPLRDKVSASVDLPLSQSAKRVLSYAADESERLQHRHIGTEHLLLGILREEKSPAAEILYERGLRLDQVRANLARENLSREMPSSEGESDTAAKQRAQSPTLKDLFNQFNRLTDLLVQRGALTREELDHAVGSSGVFRFQDGLNLLLSLLVSKGVISEAEKGEIKRASE